MSKYDVSFKVGESGSEDVIKQLEKIQKYLGALTKGETTVSVGTEVDTTGLDNASKKTETYREQVLSLGDAFQSLGSVMMGSGNLLQQFGSFFGSDIIGTASRTITSYATVLASAGFSKSIDRYDTMTTFPKMMSMMGYDADQAAEAVNTLNEAVLGLPTSLSDIVEQAQNFTTITGDLEKGVEYAIAANNTFLAGGADTSQVYYGTKQLQDLMSAGELQSMEWQSLIKAMGPSWREIGKEMGYAEDELTDFREALTGGEIDGTEFLNAMVKAATGTGKLAEMAGLSKEQIASSITNIQTAFASLGQSLIETIDESFQASQGKTLAEKIQEIGTAVKTDLKPYLNEFVRDNFPKIESFIDKLEGYDWMGMISKVAEWAALLADIYVNVITKIPASVAAFGMTWASPLGKLISGLGSFIYGLGNVGVFKSIKIGKVTETVGSLTEGIKSIGLKTLNTTGMVANMALLGLVIKEYAGIMEDIGKMKISASFTRNLKYLTAFAGSSAAITGILTAIMSAVSTGGFGAAVATGELLTAGVVGIVGLVGEVIGEYANIINNIGSMHINSTRLSRNLDVIASSMTEMQTIMAGNGLIALIAGIGELAAAGIVSIDLAVISKLVDVLVKIAEINDLDINWKSLQKNLKNIRESIVTLTEDTNAWDEMWNADTTNSMAKSAEHISTIFETWTGIIKSFKENFVDEDGTIEDVSGITEKIKENAAEINNVIDALVGDEGFLSAWSDMKATGFMGKSIENVRSVLQTWHSIQSEFKTFEKSMTTDNPAAILEDETLADKINTQLTTAAAAIKALVSKNNPIIALWDKWTTDPIEESAGHVEAVVAIWKRIQNSLVNFKVVDVSEKVASIMSNINGIADSLAGGETSTSIAPNGNTIYTPFAGVRNFFSKLGMSIEEGQNSSMLDKLLDTIDYIKDVVEHYTVMQSKVQELKIDQQVVTNVQTMFQNLYDMSNDLHSPDYTGTAGSIESWQLYLDNVHTLVETVIEISDLLKDGGFTGLQTMRTFFESRLSEFQTAIVEIDRDALDEKINNMFFMFNQLKSVFNMVRNIEIDDVVQKLDDINSMMSTQIVGLLTTLMTVQALLDKLGASGEEIPVVQMLVNMFTGLDNALSGEAAQGLNEGLTLMAENLDAITLSLYELFTVLGSNQELVEQYITALDEYLIPDLEGIVELIVGLPDSILILSDALTIFRISALGLLIDDLETLWQWVVDISYEFEVELVDALGLTAMQMNITRTATTDLTDAILNLNTAVTTLIKTFQKLQTELKNTQRQMTIAKQKANELTRAINAIPSHKTVTIDIVTNGEAPSYAATGGMIGKNGVLYRAKGGFTPKGTDTVPAMLTPGEFVMNTKAVKALGPAFFRSLNHLDVKGAMAQVSRRFMPTSYSVNNITNHDNHATVNQYITTNNEQYSYRRARRFVEAL